VGIKDAWELMVTACLHLGTDRVLGCCYILCEEEAEGEE